MHRAVNENFMKISIGWIVDINNGALCIYGQASTVTHTVYCMITIQ